MNSETPFAGDVPGDGDDVPYEWLDEWLCEYVDGTMDPSLEAVFEQYVEANPDLKAHVERLQETRDLLCECGLSKEAPSEVETDICTEVECDMLRSSLSVSETIRSRPLTAVGVVSSVAVALVVGFLVGATMVERSHTALSSSPAPPVQQMAPGFDAAASPSLPSAPTTRGSDPLFLDRSAPFAPSDSAQHPSTLTSIGLP